MNIRFLAMQNPGIYSSVNKNLKAPSHKMTLSSESRTASLLGAPFPSVKGLPVLCSIWSRCLWGWQFKSDGLTAKASQVSDSGLSPRAAALACHSQIQALEVSQVHRSKQGCVSSPQKAVKRPRFRALFQSVGKRR